MASLPRSSSEGSISLVDGSRDLGAQAEQTLVGQDKVAQQAKRRAMALDEEEELRVLESRQRITAYVFGLAISAAISGMLFGYDTGVISIGLVNLKDHLGHPLSAVESEWITASLSCGALVGALLAGPLADKWGRKAVLLIADAWFVIGAILTAAAYSVPQMIVGRICLGFGVGLGSATAPLLIAELAPTRFRAGLITFQAVCITGGQLVAYVLGVPLSLFDEGFRVMFALAAIPPIAQAVMLCFCPESPRFDLMQGRDEQARRTIARIHNVSPDARFVELKLSSVNEVVRAGQAFRSEHTLWRQLIEIVTHGNLRKTAFVSFTLMFFQQICGFNTLMYYSTTIFALVGLTTSTSIVVAATNFVFCIVSALVVDRVGKRRLLLLTVPFMVLSLAIAAAAFHMMTLETGGQLIEGVVYEAKWVNLMLGMMVLYIASYALALGAIPWHSSELYPEEQRAVGASILTSANWSGSILLSATFLSIMDAIGPSGAYGLYGGICALGFFFVLFCYPEVCTAAACTRRS